MEWFIVMRKQGWDALQLTAKNFPYPISITRSEDPDEPVGFLPIFDTLEAAEKWADGDPIQWIRPLNE